MPEDRDYCNAKVAEKVVYEFTMFTFLCDELQATYRESVTFNPGDVTFVGTGSDSSKELRRLFAFLESLLLHTRVLVDFFYKPRNPNNRRTLDDIVASDFVPDWERQRPAKDRYLGSQDRRERLDKALAHLTLARLDYDSDEKKWNVDAIRGAIESTMKQFLECLPTERKSWFNVTDNTT